MAERGERRRVSGRCGEVVGGQWRIIRMIRSGAMGRVCEAEHLAGGGGRVALKVLRGPAWQETLGEARREKREARLRARLKREAAALRRLDHPNVVALLDADLRGPVPWLALELIEGVTLADVLADRDRRGQGGLPADAVQDLMVTLASALEAVHGLGLVHRDVKPSNIMLEPAGGRIVLVDFGLVGSGAVLGNLSETFQASLSSPGAVVGTPSYMSPEQACGAAAGDVGPAADIYGLAATMVFALTGEPPIVGDALPPIGHLGALIERCLSADPSRRPTARELIDILEGRRPVFPEALSSSGSDRLRAVSGSSSGALSGALSAADPERAAGEPELFAAQVSRDGPPRRVLLGALASVILMLSLSGLAATLVARRLRPPPLRIVSAGFVADPPGSTPAWLRGHVSAAVARVRVGERQVRPEADGGFLIAVDLEHGANRVELVIEGPAGRRSTRRLEVTADLEPPILQLRGEAREQAAERGLSTRIERWILGPDACLRGRVIESGEVTLRRGLTEVPVASDGAFALAIAPESLPRRLTLEAIDGAGHRSVRTLQLGYARSETDRRALDAAEAAIGRAITEPDAWLTLARARAAVLDLDGARQALRNARLLDPAKAAAAARIEATLGRPR